MSDGHFSEEDIGLTGDFMRRDDESDVSPQERSCHVDACVDIIVGTAAAVNILVSIRIFTSVAVVVRVALGIDQRCIVIIPTRLTIDFKGVHGLATLDGLARIVSVLEFDPSVEHRHWSAAKIRSHKYTGVNVSPLLFISIYMIIVDPMVEEDMVHVVNGADSTLLGQFAKSVFVHEDFLPLLVRGDISTSRLIVERFLTFVTSLKIPLSNTRPYRSRAIILRIRQ